MTPTDAATIAAVVSPALLAGLLLWARRKPPVAMTATEREINRVKAQLAEARRLHQPRRHLIVKLQELRNETLRG